MFKKGFTLAEVLVTLGIVGVVAAMTLPSLRSNAQAQSVGPKLAKAMATLELANKALLRSEDVESISEGALLSTYDNYFNKLSNNMHIVSFNYNVEPEQADLSDYASITKENAFLSKEGFVYFITPMDTDYIDMNLPPHKRKIGYVFVDINGLAKPNKGAVDIFHFTMWDDGSLRPVGGNEWDGNSNDVTWRTSCKIDKDPSDRAYCTGHIFENNLKVRYKM